MRRMTETWLEPLGLEHEKVTESSYVLDKTVIIEEETLSYVRKGVTYGLHLAQWHHGDSPVQLG